MSAGTFNALMLLGWGMVLIGVSRIFGIAIGMTVAGALLMGLTLLVGRWAGVTPDAKDSNVPHQ